jgi:hypothetical protein
MSTKQYYYCDLCGAQIEPTTTRPAVGIYWEFDVLKRVAVQNSEHHLCISCVQQIHKINTEPVK